MKLYLGVVPGFFPWVQEPMIKKQLMKQKNGIIFSFWQFRKHIPDIIQRGIHDFFSFDGSIMIDSGAYSAHNSDVQIELKEYISFLTEISPEENDIIVNLDVIGRRKESKRNWVLLTKKLEREILPVMHFPSLEINYQHLKYIGLGGMVSALKINEKGSVFDVASWIAKLRIQTNQKFHGFGLGSPFHQIAFKDYLTSLDWMGWRRNAAIGDCYTPEGSRSISGVRKSKTARKFLSSEQFSAYHPPFIDDIQLLQLPGKFGWENRALWNVWIFLNTKKYIRLLSRSSYVNSIKKRLRNEEKLNV
ncbi:MAG: hypothetical protein KAT16_07085 [Candidatus Heimdallarchaeota archaeon]|nr:hypothetical protein [Candidatus Heimdallarchaeota archaeon]